MNNSSVIIDYNLSNLHSVKAACDYVGINALITSDYSEIKKAKSIILPGVGSYSEAMNNLKKLEIDNIIKNQIREGIPFLGICLGMQLLFESSNEFGNSNGLGILKGKVKKFEEKIFSNDTTSIPHTGWNEILINKKNNILKKISSGNYMYFVHSYYVEPFYKEIILTTTTYNNFNFCSAVSFENIYACQFHPEKSGQKGLEIYKNFKENI